MRAAALQAPESFTRQFTGPHDPLGMLITLAREYGTRYDLVSWDMAAGAFAVVTVIGFVAAWQARALAPHALWFLGLGVMVPVVITYVLVTLGAPLFASRYLLVSLPVFFLLWAGAIACLFQWGRRAGGLTAHSLLPVAGLLTAGFVLINGARWWQTAVDGTRFREDWRGAVAYLEQRHAPGEPVLVLHDASWRAVDYYRTEPMVLASLDAGPEQPPDLAKAPLVAGRAWLLAAYFEVRDLPAVEGWLETRGPLVDKTWLTGVMISEYNRVE